MAGVEEKKIAPLESPILSSESVDDGAYDEVDEIDPKAQARVLRKLDLFLAPTLTICFVSAYLDRSNIGNAAIAGMNADLGLTSNRYATAVTLFYVTYVAFEVPFPLLLKKAKPNRIIPFFMLTWSITTLCTGFMQTWYQFYVARLLLGLWESAMYPCIALYLTLFYTRNEQGLRLGYTYISVALSGAFGGLFAYLLLKLDGRGGLAGWRWLYIVEGIISVGISVLLAWTLPNTFENAGFLNEEDKKVMRLRDEKHKAYQGEEGFDKVEFFRAVKDPKVWIQAGIQHCGDIGSFGLSTFMPSIIKGFGYSSVHTQLLTIPVYAFGAIGFITLCYISDRIQKRLAIIVPVSCVTIVGYIILVTVPMEKTGPLYFSLFLITPGIYTMVGLNFVLMLNNHAPFYKRATATGMNQTIGNCAGLYIGQMFKIATKDGRYLRGEAASAGIMVLSIIMQVCFWFYLKHQNQKRDNYTPEERQARIDAGDHGDDHPDFRYMI